MQAILHQTPLSSESGSYTERTVGTILKHARIDQGVSLEDVSQQTFIKVLYLRAIEESHYLDLPAPIYTAGYIRQYAQLLGLDPSALIQQYHKEDQRSLAQTPSQSGYNGKKDYRPVLTEHQGQLTIESVSAPLLGTEEKHHMDNSGQLHILSSDKRVVDTIEGARKEALTMRHQTEQFADQVLLQLENDIKQTLSVIQNGRAFLNSRMQNKDY